MKPLTDSQIEAKKFVDECTTHSDGLVSDSPHRVNYYYGEKTIALGGQFTAEMLYEIAQHMRSTQA